MESMHRIFVALFVLFIFTNIEYVRAEVVCPPREAGKVNVVWGSDKITYDFSKTQSQMDRIKNDTISPYASHVKTHVGGLMKGGISVETSTKVASLTYQRSRETCQWVGEMNIKIQIDPQILIARDHKQGTCRHNAILEHEMKHVFVDREVVKKYIPIIQKALKSAVIKVGIVGPKPERDKQKYHKKIMDYMDEQLRKVTGAMHAERAKKQQNVDTLDEYERVQNMCR